MESAMEREGIGAFCEVNIVRDFQEGVVNITQANGYAGLQSNTVMFGWPDDAAGMQRILRMLSSISALEVSSLLARLEGPLDDQPKSTIDIWWRGKQHNGDLMLLLGYLLSLNRDWKGSRLRLRTIVPGDEGKRSGMRVALEELVSEVRIPASIEVFESADPSGVFSILAEKSADADMVFLGLKIPDPGELEDYAASLFELGNRFPNVVFVHNAGQYAGELI